MRTSKVRVVMPLSNFRPSRILKYIGLNLTPKRSRTSILHKIIEELDYAEECAKAPQNLPGEWQVQHVEPIELNVPRGAWRKIYSAKPDRIVMLRSNHFNGRGFLTQEVWVRREDREVYIEIGIQGIRIRVDGTWMAKIMRRTNTKNGHERISLSGPVEHSLENLAWLSQTLTYMLAPLRSAACSNHTAADLSAHKSNFVTIRRQPNKSGAFGSRVLNYR